MTVNFNSVRTNRRSLVGAGSGWLIAASVLPAWALEHAVNPFTQGVASGGPSPEGFVVWMRLAPFALAPEGRGGIREEYPVRMSITRSGTAQGP